MLMKDLNTGVVMLTYFNPNVTEAGGSNLETTS